VPYTTLISASDLLDHLDAPEWAVIDCRFTLSDPESGRKDYQEAHIPGALYAHLEEDLCGRIVPGKTGRHPLPSMEEFSHRLSKWGIDSRVQVVAYDDVGGALAAARLWWMLRWVGHKQAAVLNGGWTLWQKESLPVKSGIEFRRPRIFVPHHQPGLVADTELVDEMRTDPAALVLDSRTADRYLGENETIDPVAGHIPGAKSAPYPENLDNQDKFLSEEMLRKRFEQLFEDVPAERAVFYCGSGVTAAHNVLAVAHAGMGNAKLYPGSWSKWITDSSRPIATDEQE
jgi:thiosulfate/3-mercaptopyruvate sulfurtransferase